MYPKIENPEKDESKLLCKLKRDRTAIIKDIQTLMSSEHDTNQSLMNALVKIRREIGAKDDEECAIKEASLCVTEDEILDLKDSIVDHMETLSLEN